MICGNEHTKKDPESIKGGSKGATDLEPFSFKFLSLSFLHCLVHYMFVSVPKTFINTFFLGNKIIVYFTFQVLFH